jgi:hypothetical protein
MNKTSVRLRNTSKSNFCFFDDIFVTESCIFARDSFLKRCQWKNSRLTLWKLRLLSLDMRLCSFVDAYNLFGATCCLHLQGRRTSKSLSLINIPKHFFNKLCINLFLFTPSTLPPYFIKIL